MAAQAFGGCPGIAGFAVVLVVHDAAAVEMTVDAFEVAIVGAVEMAVFAAGGCVVGDGEKALVVDAAGIPGGYAVAGFAGALVVVGGAVGFVASGANCRPRGPSRCAPGIRCAWRLQVVAGGESVDGWSKRMLVPRGVAHRLRDMAVRTGVGSPH